jgi:hypothetical protein
MQPSTPKIDRAARRKAFEVAFANASPDDPTPILTAARLAKVPRPSAYRYAAKVAAQSERGEQKPLTPRQVELVAMITVEWERSHRISGAVKIHHEIRKTVRCGKNLIAKLMQRAGIKGAYNAPTVRRKRDVAPDSVDGQWHREDRKVIAADTMEFACADGRLFVAGNVDCDSRRTFAAISEKNDTRNTIASLKDAARNVQLDPGQSVTGLSDQGPQYTASPYTATLAGSVLIELTRQSTLRRKTRSSRERGHFLGASFRATCSTWKASGSVNSRAARRELSCGNMCGGSMRVGCTRRLSTARPRNSSDYHATSDARSWRGGTTLARSRATSDARRSSATTRIAPRACLRRSHARQ